MMNNQVSPRLPIPLTVLMAIVSAAASGGATFATLNGRLENVEEGQRRLEAQDDKILAIIERLAQAQAQSATQAAVTSVQYEEIKRRLGGIEGAVGTTYRGHKP